MQITALYTYPIKGLGGISLPEMALENRGLAYDRRWMLVDDEGLAITQRDIPALAQLQPEIVGDQLRIHHRLNKISPLITPLHPSADLPLTQVQVWEDSCDAQVVSREADKWFSKTLGYACQLVYMPNQSIRPLKSTYVRDGEIVGFADSCPLLVLGESSVADLNSRLEVAVPMNRFRPNIVFSGAAPYQEESWEDFQIGSIPLRGIRSCGRCQVITIDQQTGKIGQEPLRTLSTYRRDGNKVLFGLYASWLGGQSQEGSAMIKVGDNILVHTFKEI